ncbi:TPA: winged helix-turn-helix domain-containing protein [Enterobacter hormaechei]
MQGSETPVGYLLNGIVEFSPDKKTLVRKDNMLTVTLHTPASGCLVSLIEHHPSLVSQETLIIAGWADLHEHVSPNTFYQTIMGLRQSLEEVGINKDCIVTVRRRGLLLSPDVIVESLNAPMVVLPANLTPESEETINYKATGNGGYKIKNLRGYAFLASMILLLMIVISLIAKSYLPPVSMAKAEYFSSYYQLQVFEKCHIFANNPLLNYNAYVNFIKDNRLSCDQRQWWYISSDTNSPRISVLRCINNVINSQKNYCSTDYYYGRD